MDNNRKSCEYEKRYEVMRMGEDQESLKKLVEAYYEIEDDVILAIAFGKLSDHCDVPNRRVSTVTDAIIKCHKDSSQRIVDAITGTNDSNDKERYGQYSKFADALSEYVRKLQIP